MSVEVEESTNEENEGIFKKGDELLQAIQDSYKDGSHDKLVELINKDCDGTLGGYDSQFRSTTRKEKFLITTFIDKKLPKGKDVVKTIIKEVVNGTELIKQTLDNCITATNDKPNSLDFAINISFRELFTPRSRVQCHVFDHLLDFEGTREIVMHPVVATFIWAKWEKTKYYYYFQALLYLIFLSCYSVLIYQLFGGGGHSISICEKIIRDGVKKNNMEFSFPGGKGGSDTIPHL